MKFRVAVAAAAMVIAMGVSAPVAAQLGWQRVYADDEGEYSYDPGSVRRTGQRVRVTVRLVPAPSEARAAVAYIAEYDFDCAAQTSALLAVRQLGAEGEALRAVSVPPDRVRPVAITARSGDAPAYSILCPSGTALPDPPPAPPPIAVTPAGRDCEDTDHARSCSATESNPER